MKSAAILLIAVLAGGARAQTLTLEPPPQNVDRDAAATVSVGADTMTRYTNDLHIDAELPAPPGLTLVPPSRERARVGPMRGPDFLDTESYNHAEFRSNVVHLMVPGRIAPFASLAHEDARVQGEDGRLGAGAGAKWNLSRNANFGTEVLIFPSSPSNIGGDALKNADTKVMTRLELKF